jgi:alpha-tubulin suppressor-like RCC1 family protein
MKSYHKEDYFIFKDQILFNLFILTTFTNNNFPKDLILYINTIFLWLSSKKRNFVNTGDRFIILKKKDRLFGMGINSLGQLGLGDGEKRDTYHFICKNVISFSCGMHHLMILRDSGLFACGSNYCGQLGLGYIFGDHPRYILTKVDILDVFLVDCGDMYSYILTKEGLFSCGCNQYGQLGLGHQKDSFLFQKIQISKVTTLSCGRNHILIISNGKLYGCGNNYHYQLGLENDNQKGLGLGMKKTIFHEIDIKNVLSISCGDTHSMILTMDGLFSCGDNSKNQCGFAYWHSNIILQKFTKLNIDHIYSFHCGSENTLILTNHGLFMYGTIIVLDPQGKYYCDHGVSIEIKEKPILTDIIDFYCNGEDIFILNERGIYGRGDLSCSTETDYLFKKIDKT